MKAFYQNEGNYKRLNKILGLTKEESHRLIFMGILRTTSENNKEYKFIKFYKDTGECLMRMSHDWVKVLKLEKINPFKNTDKLTYLDSKYKYIRVSFSDNDYRRCIADACEHIMHDLLSCQTGEENLYRVNELISNRGLDYMHKAILLTSVGYYMANKCAEIPRYHNLDCLQDYNLDRAKSELEYVERYLDGYISLSIENEIDEDDDNMETIYMDCYNGEMFVR